jgi:hypothetical protein
MHSRTPTETLTVEERAALRATIDAQTAEKVAASLRMSKQTVRNACGGFPVSRMTAELVRHLLSAGGSSRI